MGKCTVGVSQIPRHLKPIEYKKFRLYSKYVSLRSTTHYTPFFTYIAVYRTIQLFGSGGGMGAGGRGEAPETYINQNTSFAHQYCATHMPLRYFHFKVHYSLED